MIVKDFFENDKNTIQSVPEPALRRLPRYLSYLKALRDSGITYVSSSDIANNYKMDATLVTKDLSYTGIKGRTKIGYNVNDLIKAIVDFLYFNSHENAYLFGVGNLGKALINYGGLQQYGLDIVAGFDVDSSIINTTINGIKIYHVSDFRDYAVNMKAQIGIITTPDGQAQDTTDLLVAWGVKAIWNLTPKSIKVPDNIVVVSTSIYSDLAVIRHKMKNK